MEQSTKTADPRIRILNDSPARPRRLDRGKNSVRGAIATAISRGTYPLDTLCTILTIYWVTETIGFLHGGSTPKAMRDPATKIDGRGKPKPRLGVALFPKDLVPAPPRALGARRWLNLKTLDRHAARAEHFPGLENARLAGG